MRALAEADEPALQALLRAVYGETYSYRSLYEAGGVARLVRERRATLWGDFDAGGRLVSHTAVFYKDPRADYVESGMSFRRPKAPPVTADAEVWARIFARLLPTFSFVHQNTTTWHPLAQRYAERHMRARPSGVIVAYAIGERLVGLPTPDRPMDALTMTSRVDPSRPLAGRARAVPEGPWGEWLRGVLGGFGLEAAVAPRSAPAAPLSLEVFERNDDLSLVRRVVTAATATARGAEQARDLGASTARTELVHLPMDDRVGAYGDLEDAGYVPVGVRLHATRPDEIVLQKLTREARLGALRTLREASLTRGARALVDGWSERCARTT